MLPVTVVFLALFPLAVDKIYSITSGYDASVLTLDGPSYTPPRSNTKTYLHEDNFAPADSLSDTSNSSFKRSVSIALAALTVFLVMKICKLLYIEHLERRAAPFVESSVPCSDSSTVTRTWPDTAISSLPCKGGDYTNDQSPNNLLPLGTSVHSSDYDALVSQQSLISTPTPGSSLCVNPTERAKSSISQKRLSISTWQTPSGLFNYRTVKWPE